MPIRPLKFFLPTADDVANSDVPTLGRILLVHLKSYEGQSPAVYQPIGGINREYFFAVIEHRNVGIGSLPGNGPEYGARQPEISRSLREGWNWLEKEGHLMHTPEQPVADNFQKWEKTHPAISARGAFHNHHEDAHGTIQVHPRVPEGHTVHLDRGSPPDRAHRHRS